MKITVVFDSLEEFLQHMTLATGPDVARMGFVTMEPNGDIRLTKERPAEPAQEPEKKPEPVEELPFKEDPKPAPKAPRVEDVRKALAALNKKAGKNIAKELIASVGYKKLTEVPEGALVTLQSLIEEEEKNYA